MEDDDEYLARQTDKIFGSARRWEKIGAFLGGAVTIIGLLAYAVFMLYREYIIWK